MKYRGSRFDSSIRKRAASPRWRKVRASVRDSALLLREFGLPLLLFSTAVVGGGFLFRALAEMANEPVNSAVESVYLVLSLIFLQAIGEFPEAWYLQIFYFLMPVIGISILAQGLADFGVLFFNRHARGKEWEMAVASTFSKHVVLVGLGHLGFRVMTELCQMGYDVVVVERDPKAELLELARKMNVPVLHVDGKQESSLEAAGVRKARAIAVCTQNDSLNLQIALKARQLNGDINVVLRIFDYDFAQALRDQFGFTAMSATGISAPLFAAAASGVEITRPIAVEGEMLSLASMDIQRNSRLVGRSVAEIEQQFKVSVVLMRQDHMSKFHPEGSCVLSGGDVMALLGTPEEISKLVDQGRA